jgi:hypothetical protein
VTRLRSCQSQQQRLRHLAFPYFHHTGVSTQLLQRFDAPVAVDQCSSSATATAGVNCPLWPIEVAKRSIALLLSTRSSRKQRSRRCRSQVLVRMENIMGHTVSARRSRSHRVVSLQDRTLAGNLRQNSQLHAARVHLCKTLPAPAIPLTLQNTVPGGVIRMIAAIPPPIVRMPLRPLLPCSSLILPVIRIGSALVFLPAPLAFALALGLRTKLLIRILRTRCKMTAAGFALPLHLLHTEPPGLQTIDEVSTGRGCDAARRLLESNAGPATADEFGSA